MTQSGEGLDLEGEALNLIVTVVPGSDGAEADTFIEAFPLVAHEEYEQLLDTVESHTPLGQVLRRMEESAGLSRITMEGAPNTEHVEIGVQLADELIAIRGVTAATVVTKVDQTLESFIVI